MWCASVMMVTGTVACLEQLRDPAQGQLSDQSGSAYRVTRTEDHTTTWCCENKKMKSGIGVKVECESKTSCDQYLTHSPGTDVTVRLLLPPRWRQLGLGTRRLDLGPLSDSSGAEPGSLAEAAKSASQPPPPTGLEVVVRNWRTRQAWPGHMRRRRRARAGPA